MRISRGKQSGLAEFRKQRGLSQTELGQKVAKKLGVEWTDGICQKRISNLELKISTASENEMRALSKVLGLSLEQISSQMDCTITHESIFHELSKEDAGPSLIAICCTSRPSELYDVGILRAIHAGISAKKISVALFFPGNVLSPLGTYGDLINGHIISTKKQVDEYYGVLTTSCEDAINRVKLYQPWEIVSMPFPPAKSIYYLIARRDRGTIQTSVYMWLKTLRFNQLELVDANHTEQTSIWETYFEPIYTGWKQTGFLGHGGGFWKTASME